MMKVSQAAEAAAELESIAHECTEECRGVAGQELALTNHAILILLELSFLLFQDFQQNTRSVGITVHTTRTAPTFALGALLANATNHALAVRRLTETGLNREARTIFRQLTESAELTLVFLADGGFAAIYLKSPEEWPAGYSHWKEFLRPAAIRKRLDELEGAWGANTRSERWKLYEWLSKSAHVDYTSLSVEAVAADAKGIYNPNLGGRCGPQSVATLGHLAAHLQHFLDTLAHLLRTRHGWDGSHPDWAARLLETGVFLERYRVYEAGQGPPPEAC